MVDGWLYEVGEEPDLTPPPWTDGWEGGGWPDAPDLGDLTHLVLIDGHVVDSTRHPVAGSGYECAAMELGLPRRPPRPPVQRVVHQSPHEPMLDWLERVVGGPQALADIDGEPLRAPPQPAVAALPAHEHALAQQVDERLAVAASNWLVGDEMLHATRGLLDRAAAVGMIRAWRDLSPEHVAAAVVHCSARANALTGRGAPFTVAHFLRDLGSTSAPSARSTSLAVAVGGSQWPHGLPPRHVPAVHVLGDPLLLISRFRRELKVYRDLALRLQAKSAEPGRAAG